MFDHTTYRGIGQSIGNRASLMSELARRLAEQEKKDVELRARLLEKAPEALRMWLNEDLVLTSLFQYGRCSSKVYFGGAYGFVDFDDVETKLKALGRAWRDVVFISIDEPEPHRVQIHLSAIM